MSRITLNKENTILFNLLTLYSRDFPSEAMKKLVGDMNNVVMKGEGLDCNGILGPNMGAANEKINGILRASLRMAKYLSKH
jgi:hypothetical protein